MPILAGVNTVPPITQARKWNDQARAADITGRQARLQRDTIIRALRASDPATWTISALAKAVGLAVSTVTRIIS